MLSPPANYIDDYYSGPPLDISVSNIKENLTKMEDHAFVMWAMEKVENAKAPFPIFPYGHRNDWNLNKLNRLGKKHRFSCNQCKMFDTNQKMLRKNDRETERVNMERHKISLFVNFQFIFRRAQDAFALHAASSI